MIGLFLVGALHAQTAITPSEFLGGVNDALEAGSKATIRSLFAYPDDSAYLFDMASRRGGLDALHASMIPAPPGWVGRGPYWVVIHTFQDIEEDHDPVYETVQTQTGFKLGHEVREDDLGGWRIEHEDYTARLTPEDHRADVRVHVKLHEGGFSRAPVFRLNDVYRLSGTGVIDAGDATVPRPPPNSIVRAGSLLIPWTAHPAPAYDFSYHGVVDRKSEDKINPDVAYITAWWLPSLGRLPFTVKGTIVAPAVWTVRGEGVQLSRVDHGDNQTAIFQCDLPISYPKVIGGLYRLAAERQVGDERFRIYQLEPVDQPRADHDLEAMVDAAVFFQKRFGPLPFKGYECWDADTYYGIESYSHTLLNRRITHFISHEMGHSYFGGLAPCPYVHDSWDEGVTQYVDSVLLLKDADHSLEAALDTLDERTPLSDMPVAHALQGASYWRGCYVMKMLEYEIGPDKVVDALANLARMRIGLDTRWADLRQFFERSSGESLSWFWSQWIDGDSFPTLRADNIDIIRDGGRFRTVVRVSQSGTSKPYRMKFAVALKLGGREVEKVVDLEAKSAAYTYESDVHPDGVRLKVFPYTLARVVQGKVPAQISRSVSSGASGV